MTLTKEKILQEIEVKVNNIMFVQDFDTFKRVFKILLKLLQTEACNNNEKVFLKTTEKLELALLYMDGFLEEYPEQVISLHLEFLEIWQEIKGASRFGKSMRQQAQHCVDIGRSPLCPGKL